MNHEGFENNVYFFCRLSLPLPLPQLHCSICLRLNLYGVSTVSLFSKISYSFPVSPTTRAPSPVTPALSLFPFREFVCFLVIVCVRACCVHVCDGCVCNCVWCVFPVISQELHRYKGGDEITEGIRAQRTPLPAK